MTYRVSETELRQYVLGALDEPAEARLEAAYLADPELVSRLEAAEHDLVDDFVAGRLGDAERDRFIEHYLTTPAHLQQVAVARALRQRGAASAAPSAEPAGEQVRRRPLPAWALPLAAAVVVGLGLVLVSRSRTTPPPSKSAEVAPAAATSGPSRPSPDPAAPPIGAAVEPPPARPPIIATVFLRAGLSRGAGESPVVTLAPDTSHVELRFPNELAGAVATVRVETPEGRLVWSGPAVPAPLRATVPRRVLERGDYLVIAVPSSSTLADDPAQYPLRVR